MLYIQKIKKTFEYRVWLIYNIYESAGVLPALFHIKGDLFLCLWKNLQIIL